MHQIVNDSLFNAAISEIERLGFESGSANENANMLALLFKTPPGFYK
ncbi:MAG: hypothetical protein ABIX01_01060 [Chitinophagaceae bacterium]